MGARGSGYVCEQHEHEIEKEIKKREKESRKGNQKEGWNLERK